ncbi:mannose-1-phosphate guanylyltransferase/mannose-6-phosphate isomerase [Psychrobium sp. MM17-31]|uniref:mannose-1-phosphate guanylyltransferase/mannose-6-phosphate isomerase n=1 Tax=Psychrobium sp. MM17-31 TaxID=2917758 RepID=UPI001EF6696B|nr:mannose-1-phosphate guanylyltransferase/mannose-6-phosphate isomerase [Psychrobium sp. MM17-31]MCG7531320.1 mannose-1-phosphate guanylyltransferase/mannose-6-phosphate isomerase [Psychrobium sp. MM17-31]
MILPVIMAGGNGSRLWPLSRQLFPKQFLKLHSDDTMLQSTVSRLQDIEHQPPLIICNEEHRFVVAEQLRSAGLNHGQILLEPVGRNTAPAIALAAFNAVNQGQDPLLLVLAADHVIQNTDAFTQAVEQAATLAAQDKLVTFGITPTHPETGYGYIKAGVMESNSAAVEQFVEKPDLATAQDYLQSGNYFWNSGMFMFKANVFLDELKQHRPDIYSACQSAMNNTSSDLDFIRIDKTAFELCPDDSIDYAVMEKTAQAMVVPMNADWSDIGSWSALWDIEEKDDNGNVCHGDVLNVDSRNSYINAQDKLVATVGLDNVVIVETKDAILVADKSKVQNVKDVVNELKAQGRSEVSEHREVYRPWGKYDSLDDGNRFKVKRITVKPGARLSTQMHHHRAEHWIVVTGTAKVIKDNEEVFLTENQSTYIPVGSVHSLENPGMVDLELIEVQSGGYLGEDDIVRFDDKYGRE